MHWVPYCILTCHLKFIDYDVYLEASNACGLIEMATVTLTSGDVALIKAKRDFVNGVVLRVRLPSHFVMRIQSKFPASLLATERALSHLTVFALKVSDLHEVNGRKYRCLLSDGSSTIRGVLASQFADLIVSGELSNSCLVKIKTFITNTVGNEDVLLATDLIVVAPGDGSLPMDAETALTAHNATPEASRKTVVGKTPCAAIDSKENSTPMLSPPTE